VDLKTQWSMKLLRVSSFYLIGWDYYSKHGWTDNPEDPYVWMDDKGLWYKQMVGTKERIYFEVFR